jgi:hypothetical protein
MPDTPKFAAMTVNERLFAAGLIEAWDAATSARDRDRMIGILERVDMGGQAATTVDAVLANPPKYGH